MINVTLEESDISLNRIPIEKRVCQWAENYYRWIRKGMITEKEFADSLVNDIKGMIKTEED
jgi:hypothetical protein